MKDLIKRVLGRSVIEAPNPNRMDDFSMLDRIPEPFRSKLVSMYNAGSFLGTDGIHYPAQKKTTIRVIQGLAIYDICRSMKSQKTLEIGLAYGFSTMYFLAAQQNGAHHTAIDPFIFDWWHGIGLQNVKDVGKEIRLIQEVSLTALPKLFQEKFDVIFIDGNHRFDDVLTDFFLCSMLCPIGGHIMLDDMWMPSIQKVVSFIRSNRLDFVEVKTDVWNIALFKKVSEDERPWDHFSDFI